MDRLSHKQFTAFVGIDWANAKHDICLQAQGSDEREFSVIPHNTEKIEEWAQALYKRFGGPIATLNDLFWSSTTVIVLSFKQRGLLASPSKKKGTGSRQSYSGITCPRRLSLT